MRAARSLRGIAGAVCARTVGAGTVGAAEPSALADGSLGRAVGGFAVGGAPHPTNATMRQSASRLKIVRLPQRCGRLVAK